MFSRLFGGAKTTTNKSDESLDSGLGGFLSDKDAADPRVQRPPERMPSNARAISRDFDDNCSVDSDDDDDERADAALDQALQDALALAAAEIEDDDDNWSQISDGTATSSKIMAAQAAFDSAFKCDDDDDDASHAAVPAVSQPQQKSIPPAVANHADAFGSSDAFASNDASASPDASTSTANQPQPQNDAVDSDHENESEQEQSELSEHERSESEPDESEPDESEQDKSEPDESEPDDSEHSNPEHPQVLIAAFETADAFGTTDAFGALSAHDSKEDTSDAFGAADVFEPAAASSVNRFGTTDAFGTVDAFSSKDAAFSTANQQQDYFESEADESEECNSERYDSEQGESEPSHSEPDDFGHDSDSERSSPEQQQQPPAVATTSGVAFGTLDAFAEDFGHDSDSERSSPEQQQQPPAVATTSGVAFGTLDAFAEDPFSSNSNAFTEDQVPTTAVTHADDGFGQDGFGNRGFGGGAAASFAVSDDGFGHDTLGNGGQGADDGFGRDGFGSDRDSGRPESDADESDNAEYDDEPSGLRKDGHSLSQRGAVDDFLDANVGRNTSHELDDVFDEETVGVQSLPAYRPGNAFDEETVDPEFPCKSDDEYDEQTVDVPVSYKSDDEYEEQTVDVPFSYKSDDEYDEQTVDVDVPFSYKSDDDYDEQTVVSKKYDEKAAARRPYLQNKRIDATDQKQIGINDALLKSPKCPSESVDEGGGDQSARSSEYEEESFGEDYDEETIASMYDHNLETKKKKSADPLATLLFPKRGASRGGPFRSKSSKELGMTNVQEETAATSPAADLSTRDDLSLQSADGSAASAATTKAAHLELARNMLEGDFEENNNQDNPAEPRSMHDHSNDVGNAGTGEEGNEVESSGSEYETGSDESDSDDDNVDGKQFKLVVKEAPLLRLENVTAQTRAYVPDRKEKKAGGWGWFGFSKTGKKGGESKTDGTRKEDKEDETPVKEEVKADATVVAESENPGPEKAEANQAAEEAIELAPTAVASASPSKQNSVASIAGSEAKGAASNRGVEKLKSTPDSRPVGSKPSEQKQEPDQPISAETNKTAPLETKVPVSKQVVKSVTIPEQPSVVSPPPVDMAKVPESPKGSSSSHKATALSTSVPESPIATARSIILSPGPAALVSPTKSVASSAPSLASPSKSISSPSKRKKKKKGKKDLEELFGKTKARKVGRHGDEVSVGTTTLQKRGSGAAHVVLAAGSGMFDEAVDTSKQRPWENSVPSKRKGKFKTSLEPSKLGIFGTITEEGDVLEELENLKSSEHLFRDDLPTKNSLLNTLVESEEEEADHVSFSGDTRSVESGNGGDSEGGSAKEDEDGLNELTAISELESKLNVDTEDVDFDDMWDTVSCDASTSLEFERKKREQNKEREKRRLQREKEREEKAAQRLRLFERENDKSKKRKKNRSKLSTEFVKAIQNLFDDVSVVGSDDDGSKNGNEKIVDLPNGMLPRRNSLKSVFINEEEDEEGSKGSQGSDGASLSGSNSGNGSGSDSDSEIDAKEKQGDQRTDQSARSRRSRGGRLNEVASSANSRSSRRSKANSKSSRRSKGSTRSNQSSQSRKPRLDPAEIFEEEMKKAKGSKILSVSKLRQEMFDRRGTSVNLVKKEYADYTKRKAQHIEEIDFSDLAKCSSSPATRFGPVDEVFESPTKRNQKAAVVGGGVGGLGSHMSRWGSHDGVSELDDLATVMQSPAVSHHGVLSMAQELTQTVNAHLSHLPAPNLELPKFSDLPKLPDIPKLADVQSAIKSHLPSIPLSKLPGAGGAQPDNDFAFNATFNDMPLTTIAESDDDDDDALGLFAKQKTKSAASAAPFVGNDDEQSRFSVPSNGSKGGGKLKLKLGGTMKKMKLLVKRDSSGRGYGGVAKMDLLGDNDERGLLG